MLKESPRRSSPFAPMSFWLASFVTDDKFQTTIQLITFVNAFATVRQNKQKTLCCQGIQKLKDWKRRLKMISIIFWSICILIGLQKKEKNVVYSNQSNWVSSRVFKNEEDSFEEKIEFNLIKTASRSNFSVWKRGSSLSGISYTAGKRANQIPMIPN